LDRLLATSPPADDEGARRMRDQVGIFPGGIDRIENNFKLLRNSNANER
jgi:hypothetical protein